ALVEQVEVSNQNIRLVEAQFRQARALAQQARSEYFPLLTGGVSTIRNKPPSNVSNAQNFNPSINTTYRLNLDASWEPDIWGRVARSVEAGSAGMQASTADIEAAKLSAQAELAQNYFLLRISDARKKLLDDTVAAYERSLQLTKNQYAVGVVARADVVTSETQLKSAKAQAVDVGIQRAQLEHAIAVLIGKVPAEFSLPPANETFTAVPPSIPLGIPSQLLERRPDIAAAERRTAQANARIGVAQAAFFPSLILSATLGYQSRSFANWLTLPSRFWSLGPALAQTIFDGGFRKAQKAEAIAVFDQNAANYRQTVLTAFQEVEDNLASLRILEEEAQLQEDAVKSARESVQLTLNQYKAGIVNYLNVVNVETIALTNERTMLNIQSSRMVAAVLLVKALGGGWHAAELEKVAKP
ncbi:MAG TPA: efflux transporter outer membrane subunit, partial [Methylophilaceae bacterium]|nr:efflux transporter outer membrane subunit [Methylophilaceae bacterium]